MTSVRRDPPPRQPPAPRQRPWRVVDRNLLVYRRRRLSVVTGFLEPVFYLLSVGYGVGGLIGRVQLANGHSVDYASYVGPALVASAAMNDAIADTTSALFYRLRYVGTYDALLNTPISIGDVARGETLWIVIRTAIYSAAFLLLQVILGLVTPAHALLVLPVATLTGFTFAACGLAAATLMRNNNDYEFVALAVVPLFLFSTTLYPLSVYPGWLQKLIVATPLYHGITLARQAGLAQFNLASIVHVGYLLVLGLAAVAYSTRRLGHKLIH